MRTTPAWRRTVIAQAARVALARGVAFHLTIESHYFWQSRPDLWNFFDPTQPDYDPAHVANVEWTDWAQTGFRWRFADWGVPQELSAPHMCYLSTAVQAEVARLGGEVGTEVRAAMDMLADAGHPELFSGVTVDFEPSLDNYTNIDTIDPGIAQLMDDAGAPKVRLGYCAFTALGYSAANPPPDAGAAAALANQLFVESWAGAVADAGVPASRLYTHIAANARGYADAGLHERAHPGCLRPFGATRLDELSSGSAVGELSTAARRRSRPTAIRIGAEPRRPPSTERRRSTPTSTFAGSMGPEPRSS
jgi:hypothetical protein